MIHTGKSLDDELSTRRLTMIVARLERSDDRWFNGTLGAVDARLRQVDSALRFARGVTARIGSTEAGIRCADVLPKLELHRNELVALRDDLLNGASTRRGDAARTGRRLANTVTSYTTTGPDPSSGYGTDAKGTNWDDVWRNTVQDWPNMHPDHKKQIIQDSMDAGVQRPNWHRNADVPRVASRDFAAELLFD